MSARHQVLLVDPDPRSRRRWRRILARGGLRVAETNALAKVAESEAQVVLIDERMLSGGIALPRLAEGGRVLLLVATDEPDVVPDGIEDVLFRSASPPVVLRRILLALRITAPIGEETADTHLLQVAHIAELSRTTSDLAHRLRSPIAAALGALELAEEHIQQHQDLELELAALALHRSRTLLAALPPKLDIPVGQRRSLQQSWRSFLARRDLPSPPGLLPLVAARGLRIDRAPGDQLARWLESDPPAVVAAAIDHMLGTLHLSNALSSVERTATLLEEVRAFSQLSTQGQAVDVHQSLETAVRASHYTLARLGEVTLELPQRTSWTWAIPAALHQVWTELLRNAGRALHGGDGQVIVRANIENDDCVVRILDSGHGVPEADRDRIFLPWFSTWPDRHGLGLGQVRRTLELHGGTIQLEPHSQLTCFRVALPRAEPPGARDVG